MIDGVRGLHFDYGLFSVPATEQDQLTGHRRLLTSRGDECWDGRSALVRDSASPGGPSKVAQARDADPGVDVGGVAGVASDAGHRRSQPDDRVL